MTDPYHPSPPPSPAPLPARARAAVAAVAAVNGTSRLLGRGSGTVIGGRAGLAVDPGLLTELGRGRRVAVVTGTNGKTTTTRLLAAALEGAGRTVVSNTTGANMPAGHVAALAADRRSAWAVLEVDEGYLPHLLVQTRPAVVVLLNLSRDQLDRIAEVRMLVDRWRAALSGLPGDTDCVVVANADDPMVVWAAREAPAVRWVGAGQVWHEDAVGCPSCGGRIAFSPDGDWSCGGCDFARPGRDAWVDGDDLVTAGGDRYPIALGLPGRFNVANAAMAAVAAPIAAGDAAMAAVAAPIAAGDVAADGAGDAAGDAAGVGLTPDGALRRMAAVDEVAGRFGSVIRAGRPVRLMLAKNPAGWTAIFDLLGEAGDGRPPTVLSVNARVADGLDTSWLWDVPFERLQGSSVVATGERCRDLAVRLRYAEVDHTTVEDPLRALDTAVARAGPGAPVEFLGNYTAFADLRGRL